MKLSVVIPTYNQSQVLPKSITAIFGQSLPREQYEVLVINDGSTDETSEVVKSLQEKFKFRCFSQENRGAGAARNKGIKEAKGEIIVLIQDDIIVTLNFLEEHLRFHQKNPAENVAVVGFTTWHPDLKITPFMRWLEHGGPQFDYDRISGKLEVDHLAFYTCNLSLKRDFLVGHPPTPPLRQGFEGLRGITRSNASPTPPKQPLRLRRPGTPPTLLRGTVCEGRVNGLFDESFAVSGGTAYEDTELGWRLSKKGMKLLYNPSAITYHYHPKTLKSVCRRRFFEGKISHKLHTLHPDLKMIGKSDSLWHNITHLKTGFLSDKIRFRLTSVFLNKFTIRPIEKLALFLEDKVNIPLVYKVVCGYHYNRGYGETSGREEGD